MNLSGMEAHLSTSWLKIMGEEISFATHIGASVELAAHHFIVITLHSAAHGSPAGVGLAIAGATARRLAGRVFDIPEEAASDADINDACKELSNVFASGVPTHITDHEELELGLPSALSAAQFLDMFQASKIKESYLAQQDGNPIQVIVFEQLALQQPTSRSMA